MEPNEPEPFVSDYTLTILNPRRPSLATGVIGPDAPQASGGAMIFAAAITSAIISSDN